LSFAILCSGDEQLEQRFFSSYIWCGEWTGKRFIFLSANGKAQSALLLFLLSLGVGEKI